MPQYFLVYIYKYKKYEEIYRGTPESVLKELTDPKGEFVIIVEGNAKEESYENIDVLKHVNELITNGKSEKEAPRTQDLRMARRRGLRRGRRLCDLAPQPADRRPLGRGVLGGLHR